MTITALKGHVSPDTAYVVADYPYGFRVRTSIRYWLETNGHGTRFVSQTVNPKTGAWNKPKASTYTSFGVMVRDESNGHISWVGWHLYGGAKGLAQFAKDYTAALTDFDLAHIVCLEKMYAAHKAAGVAP